MFHFDKNKVAWLKPIGNGTYGKVYPYKNDQWVVKELKTNTQKFKSDIQELVIGFNHDHPFIMSIAGYHVQDCGNGEINIYLRMPRMKETLEEFICNKNEYKKKDSFDKNTVIRWLYCLADALRYLKKKNIAHRDIKPANILKDYKNNIYLSDLGLCKFAAEDITAYVTNIAGSPNYMAPELNNLDFLKKITNEDFFRADIWSLGMTILELCSDSKISNKLTREDIEIKLCQIEKVYGPELREILSNLLAFDPHERWSFEQICEYLEDEFSDKLGEVFETLEKRIEDLNGGYFCKNRKNFFTKVNKFLAASQALKNSLDDKFKFDFLEEFSIEPYEAYALTTDELQKYLGHIFETINHENSNLLRNIKLNFGCCVKMNAEVARLIKFDSSHLNRVQKLSLNFLVCEEMLTKEGKLPFESNCFQGLTGLKSLDLNFSGLENFTNENFEEVLSLICESLPKLENLSLNFTECPEIRIANEASIDKLKKDLNKLPTLRELSIKSEGLSKKWTEVLKNKKLKVVI